MRRLKPLALAAAFALCPATAEAPAGPVTTAPWAEVTASVSDLDRTAAFFRDLGAYETLWRGPVDAAELDFLDLPEGASGEALVLRAPGASDGYIRLVRFADAGPQAPTRPAARAWDTGCFWSVMVRMKDMQAAYDRAIALGWWTETPIAYHEFGPSKLNIVVFKGPDGVQVQAYERLASEVPPGFEPFDLMSRPFNVMQMVRDKDAFAGFVTGTLGVETFFNGDSTRSAEPEVMPLGIPINLTTTIPYRAGIFFPQAGEFGRLEGIEIDGLDGQDYSARCRAPNLGILSVSYPVEDLEAAKATLEARGATILRGPDRIERPPYGAIDVMALAFPDGGTLEFFAPASPAP